MTDRRTALLRSATTLARDHGLYNITRADIARHAGVPAGSFRLVGSMDEIRAAIVDADPSLGPLVDDARVQERDALILNAAVGLAEAVGYHRVTRRLLAKATGYAPATISKYGGGCTPVMAHIAGDIMKRAVAGSIVTLVAQGLVRSDPIALAAPDDLKRRAVNSY